MESRLQVYIERESREMTNILKATAMIASATTVALFTAACSDDGGDGGGGGGSYDPNASYSVTIKTNKGDIEADLYNDIASVYVENFVNLANRGFYTNSQWHRVIPGFVIQGGTNADGEQVAQFEDVFHPNMIHDSAGILSMANAGLNTNTSQFFITHDATPHLDPYVDGEMKPCHVRGTSCHAVFGKVTEGMDVVLSIEQGDVMESVEVHKR